MRKNINRILGIFLSLLLILSVVTIPSFKSKAAAGTVDDFVERCYTVTLGRGSDPEGFADWKGQLTSGKAVGVHVAYGFLFSSEYTKKNKSNSAYVRDLYTLFMGRDPDDSGYNDWMNQLDEGKSRLEVFAGFANSQEFYNICESYGITAGRWVNGYDRYQVNNVNLFVERLYKVCFERIGDRGGQKDWVEKLLNKQITGSECARSFIQSQEYENLGLSNEDYVENLYIALMGRASDAPGKADWVTKLANGMTRDEVFAGFVNSAEFAGICNTYKIDRGSYTAKNKGTYDPNNVNNNQNNNNQNNNNQNNNNQNNNNQNNNNQNNNNQNNNNQNNNNQNNNQNNNNQNNNNQNNNNQNNNEKPKKTGTRLTTINVDYFDGDGDPYGDSVVYTYTYGSENNTFPKSIVITDKSTGEKFAWEDFEFDKNGYVSKEIAYETIYTGATIKTCDREYKNDKNGNIIEKTDNGENRKTVVKYNSQGEMTEADYYFYDHNYNKVERIVYTLNSQGKPVSGCLHYVDKTGAEKTRDNVETLEYDSDGNLIKMNVYYEPGFLERFYTETITVANGTYTITDPFDYVRDEYNFEYDSNGNMTLKDENHLKKSGPGQYGGYHDTEYYQYKYDKKGNIIEKITQNDSFRIVETMEYGTYEY
ncbi:MAG: DUF4214 domain-containing protein [Lachnospiraceae bacterium]|nr:DUF4214 domain-containing protein [Lachnospiraceae bacterium]